MNFPRGPRFSRARASGFVCSFFRAGILLVLLMDTGSLCLAREYLTEFIQMLYRMT